MALIEIIRAILTPIILYNLVYTYKGPLELLKSKVHPISIYRSVLFFSMLPVLGFNLVAFTRFEDLGEGNVSLAMLLLFLLANIGMVAGNLLNMYARFDEYTKLLEGENLSIATKAVTLYALEPELMDEALNRVSQQAINNKIG